MPDVAMCTGDDCPLRKKCYRAVAPENPYWQSWFAEPPGIWHTPWEFTCESYWPVREADGAGGKQP